MRKRSRADGWVEDGVHRKNPGHEEERGDIDPSLYHSLNATGNPHYQLCSPLLHGDVWYIEQIQAHRWKETLTRCCGNPPMDLTRSIGDGRLKRMTGTARPMDE